MKKIKIILVVLALWSTSSASAQLGATKEEIKAKLDCEFEDGVLNGNVPFIFCTKKYLDEGGQMYSSSYYYYFNKVTNKCIARKILEPLSKVNSWINLCNERYVSIGKMTWRDYKNDVDIVISINSDDKTVSILSFQYI